VTGRGTRTVLIADFPEPVIGLVWPVLLQTTVANHSNPEEQLLLVHHEQLDSPRHTPGDSREVLHDEIKVGAIKHSEPHGHGGVLNSTSSSTSSAGKSVRRRYLPGLSRSHSAKAATLSPSFRNSRNHDIMYPAQRRPPSRQGRTSDITPPKAKRSAITILPVIQRGWKENISSNGPSSSRYRRHFRPVPRQLIGSPREIRKTGSEPTC
jgi:hypothetical protein